MSQEITIYAALWPNSLSRSVARRAIVELNSGEKSGDDGAPAGLMTAHRRYPFWLGA